MDAPHPNDHNDPKRSWIPGQYDQTDRCYFRPLYGMDRLPQGPFRYIFPDLATQTYFRHQQVEDKAAYLNTLDQLAAALVAPQKDSPFSGDIVPASFTYYGQFIDHDISLANGESVDALLSEQDLEPLEPSDVEVSLEAQQTPRFDLESVYGGPGAAYLDFPHFYQEADPLLFKVNIDELVAMGSTYFAAAPLQTDRPLWYLSQLNILAEFPDEDEETITPAIIGDLRNDENLVLAKFHLAFLKFHNRIVQELRQTGNFHDDQELFMMARGEVTRIYQWLFMSEFLPQILCATVYEDILNEPPSDYGGEHRDEKLFMPIEFATAAYRFGHNMIRERYDRIRHNGQGNIILDPKTFEQLFEFSGKKTSLNPRFRELLPHSWVMKWDRFVSTWKEKDQPLDRPSPEHCQEIMKHLSQRNLRRGFLFNIPSGQEIIDELEATGVASFHKLQIGDLLAFLPRELQHAFVEQDLLNHTPLWYYLMKESEVQEKGERLGELGSWLVGKTFSWLIAHSPVSIIQDNWTPNDSIVAGLRNVRTVVDFLIYAGVAPNPSHSN